MTKLKTIFLFLFLSQISYAVNDEICLFTEIPLYFSKAEKINEFTTRIPFKLVNRLIVIEGVLNDKK